MQQDNLRDDSWNPDYPPFPGRRKIEQILPERLAAETAALKTQTPGWAWRTILRGQTKIEPPKIYSSFLTRQTRTWTDILDSPGRFLVQNIQNHLTPQCLDEKVIYNPTWEVHNSQQYPNWQLGKFISIHQRHEPLLCGHRHFTQSQWLHMMIVQLYNMVNPVVNHLQRWRYIIERHTQVFLFFFGGGCWDGNQYDFQFYPLLILLPLSSFVFYLLLNHHQHRCMHIYIYIIYI